MKHRVEAALAWAGLPVDPVTTAQLARFGEWLRAEAIPAGGLGPNEEPRIESRHLADSVTFAAGLNADPDSVLDVGAGVGLPGLPLAILYPRTEFVLLDKSGRRVELIRRAIRVLALENATAVEADVLTFKDSGFDGLVMRAALQPRDALGITARILNDSGAAVVGLSRRQASKEGQRYGAEARKYGLSATVIDVPVLDSPAALLRITHE